MYETKKYAFKNSQMKEEINENQKIVKVIIQLINS